MITFICGFSAGAAFVSCIWYVFRKNATKIENVDKSLQSVVDDVKKI